MGREFGMSTGTVHNQGVRISGLAEDFGVSRKKIMSIVDRILASAYVSDDARAIAREIKTKDLVLTAIQAKLDAHGNFARYASNRTEATQEEIISNIGKKNNLFDFKN